MDIHTVQEPIVLASQSPRRKQLLREAGIAFEVVSPRYEEPDPTTWPSDPISYVESVSFAKARSISDSYPDRIILAADTTVALGNRMFGKPVDAADASRILGSLVGTTHRVITGVVLYQPTSGRRIFGHAMTLCRMRPMSQEQFDAYIRSGGWQGKAGAYGIQDGGDVFVELEEGSFSNVVGLPIDMVLEMLADFGIHPKGW
jgi:septum formation protein